MNVHLLRSPELKIETYHNVLNLLEPFKGPMKFIACEEDLIESNTKQASRIWKQKEDFEKLRELKRSFYSSSECENSIIFPHEERVKTWEQLFAECDTYRRLKALPDEDLVVLLTDVGNDMNWFGGVSETMNNYFVQTSNWEYFFGNTIDIRFPIAYEVIIWVMRNKMFKDRAAMSEGVHKVPIGCIMDFCKDKSQIILKMRTADVCESCMNKFIEQDIPTLYSRQFFDVLDGIRNSMTFRGRAVLLKKPSKLEIKRYNNTIFFTDLGNLELKLNPKERAVFLFFLNQSTEGIKLKDLKQKREDLFKYYSLNSIYSKEFRDKVIDELVDPKKNEINVVISRINKKIKDAIGESLSEFYCIKGERGEKKRIKIDRELISGLT